MTSPIPPISPLAGIDVMPGVASVPQAAPGFSLPVALESVAATEQAANVAAQQLATGQLTNIHDYTVAAAKASLAIELTTAVRNRAVEAYQEIMRMQV